MSWEREVLSETAERLAERNGATLLAVQLQSQVQRYLDTLESHAMEISTMRSTLSEAERVGLAVMRAGKAGRRTIKVSSLLGCES